ncbi:hypothetical protein BDZ97DRAFT_916558 [Flammula alnicola]|nr:hypothetical protein BDZ97DRAFT_916558 [Flammula alnicola]
MFNVLQLPFPQGFLQNKVYKSQAPLNPFPRECLFGASTASVLLGTSISDEFYSDTVPKMQWNTRPSQGLPFFTQKYSSKYSWRMQSVKTSGASTLMIIILLIQIPAATRRKWRACPAITGGDSRRVHLSYGVASSIVEIFHRSGLHKFFVVHRQFHWS